MKSKKLTTHVERRARRHARVRAKISGTAVRPRLSVTRTIRSMFLQLIDDDAGKTLASVHSKKDVVSGDVGDRKGKTAVSYLLGKELAVRAQAANISSVVFDRSGHKYHGRVQAAAEGARDGGLKF